MVIFMIHGMWATATFWDNYRDFFIDKGYSTKAMTLLHHGESPETLKGIRVMDYIEQAGAEIEKLDSKPIIVGHSMGGLIAQKLAETGLAEKLVLLAPSAPRGISVLTLSVAITFSANISNVFLKRPFLIPFRNASYGLMNTMSKSEQIKAYQDFVCESGLAAYEIARGEIDVDESKVTCPALVIVGKQDRATPPKAVKRVASKYNALYVEYPKYCHHSLTVGSGWQKVAQGILNWLEGEEARIK